MNRYTGQSRTVASQSGPLPPALAWPARLASYFYAFGVKARNRRFDEGRSPAQRLPVPVISVGNITAGGTGKTPFTSWLAGNLRASGHHPVIAMRGYKAARDSASDEQEEHRRRQPDVHVVANPHRFRAVSDYLTTHPDCDCVLLDDGFQHRQLVRDLDLVLVDVTRTPPDRDHLLPAGWLREPAANLARADAVILTRADLKDDVKLDDIRKGIAGLHGRPPLAEFSHIWTHLTLDTGEERPVSWLARARVVIACAIGNPRSVVEMAGQCGAIVVGSHVLKDHARYRTADLKAISGLAAAADAVLTTEKDWSKLEPMLRGNALGVPVVRPFLEMRPIVGLESLNKAVMQAVARDGSTRNDS